eukprot:CAMPEP_0195066430 /NCGR_PEP_ID=MMETSP0448-20130528/11786_1 /TAXON_ID=66468 /ORGANISM="Heterocapsa triquestra, Strain CCMP 448" /LENGTH=115 /DNA_ID=CAMNT_0040097679 /DNA_START=105 /DNA_END=448 /DNA_ORIENTATION=+
MPIAILPAHLAVLLAALLLARLAHVAEFALLARDAAEALVDEGARLAVTGSVARRADARQLPGTQLHAVGDARRPRGGPVLRSLAARSSRCHDVAAACLAVGLRGGSRRGGLCHR